MTITVRLSRHDGIYYTYVPDRNKPTPQDGPLAGVPPMLRLEVHRYSENMPGMNWVVIDSNDPHDLTTAFDTLAEVRTYISETYWR